MFKAASKFKFLLLTALSISVFFACKKHETLPPLDYKWAYYPLKLNSVIVYRVDSTQYFQFSNSKTTYNFELKDSVVSDISEGSSKTFVIHRYKRPLNGAWAFQKVITRTLTGLRAEEFIDNIKFVRLVFPPQIDKYWKGNTYNNLNDYATFSITGLDQKVEINSHVLDSTLTVEEVQEDNLIRQYYATAIYAKNIGLVQRYEVNGQTEITDTIIKEGYRYTMKLISFK